VPGFKFWFADDGQLKMGKKHSDGEETLLTRKQGTLGTEKQLQFAENERDRE